MSKQIYYGSSYAAGSGGSYSIRGAEPYLPSAGGSSRYSTDGHAFANGSERVSSLYPTQSNGLRISTAEISGVSVAGSFSARKIGPGMTSVWRMADGSGVTEMSAGSKRSAEALYNQSILAHSTIGPSDALLSSYSYLKHPKLISSSHLPMYPQRPGEKDCPHYMMTRTCKFGEACKFDHPIWVPEGGIPDWKEVPLVPVTESLPERPGEPDCPYFLKTQTCKFGLKCKFNHPKENSHASVNIAFPMNSELPERPLEPACPFYEKTGTCKFGTNCKFNHPKDIQVVGKETGNPIKIDQTIYSSDAVNGDMNHGKTFIPFTPAAMYNMKGLPIRPGETDCPFYVKTGSCKFGATCRFNHPDRLLINPMHTTDSSNAYITPAVASLPIGVMNPAASFLPTIDSRLSQLGVSIYPQRPGEIECDYYMKTGQCKFGERCRYHHPIDRSAPATTIPKPAQENVKLTLAGLPRREGSVACPFYMKTGTCKYAVACRFDHPPPGEAIAMASAGNTASGEELENNLIETAQ
ncbi:Zinc finger CCCH domain-containing protein 37 [Platanthera guangdongensis]|uniref:Zinc finger CCCH domain-containing protein 37 n=1 Tax=Platanthera guangdongensis TaxID=2320717 RepID=A0ABR2LKF0_9ASPA